MTYTFSVVCVTCGERSLYRMDLAEVADDGRHYDGTHPLVVDKILECEGTFIGRGWARNQHEWYCPRCLPPLSRRGLN